MPYNKPGLAELAFGYEADFRNIEKYVVSFVKS